MSDKFPGDADAAGTTLGEPQSYSSLSDPIKRRLMARCV